MFYFDNINGKRVLKTDFIKDAHAFFTTRESVLKSQDEAISELVTENKKDIAKYLDIPVEDLISPVQTHSANIQAVEIGKFYYPDTDGLIVTHPNQAIFLNFADCTPIIFYDEKQNIGAVSHAGWRGTAQKIAARTVEKMVNEYSSQLKNIKAVIGPAISLCCYDVGEEVFEKLAQTVQKTDDLFENRGGKIFVDLKGINQRQLGEIGIEDVEVCPYCTVCDNKYFFSYRKEQGTTNRHSAVLKLR